MVPRLSAGRVDAMTDTPTPEDDQNRAAARTSLMENAAKLIGLASQHKALAVAAGFSEDAAEQMAVHFHGLCCRAMPV